MTLKSHFTARLIGSRNLIKISGQKNVQYYHWEKDKRSSDSAETLLHESFLH